MGIHQPPMLNCRDEATGKTSAFGPRRSLFGGLDLRLKTGKKGCRRPLARRVVLSYGKAGYEHGNQDPRIKG